MKVPKNRPFTKEDYANFDPSDMIFPLGAIERNLCKSIGKIANKFRRSKKEIEKAIHEVKDELPKGKIRNPDVDVDLNTGEVYPKVSGGGVGDSIGNINDHLKVRR
ncbi:MAG: hypothetical protein GY777_07245 [Candidatus Brocadiaceae bacterium]|nr:hypothetical protein [Candidatus Brocadiaceae bacterium]